MCLPLRVHVHSLQAAEASTAGAKVLRDGAINSGGGKYLTEIDAGRWHQGLKGFEHTSTLPSVVAAALGGLRLRCRVLLRLVVLRVVLGLGAAKCFRGADFASLGCLRSGQSFTWKSLSPSVELGPTSSRSRNSVAALRQI